MAGSKIVKGVAVRVEVGITEATAIDVSAVSKANPGVATSTAHGLLAKSVAFFQNVQGMEELEGQAVRFSAVDTNTLTLEDLDTTDYTTYTDGELVPVTAWATLQQATEYSIPDSAADSLDTSTLLQVKKSQESGQLAAETVTLNLNALEEANPALAYVRSKARKGLPVVFRITLKNGAVRIWRGVPSLPGEGVAKSAVGTSSFSSTVMGNIIYGAA